MQSFLFKTICCILIINATFCSGCFRSICKARCYFKHSGFDFGYCEQGICKCAPPIIYVFDGIDRDLSDEYIDNSSNNNNVIQNLTPKSSTSASNISDENKKNKQQKKNDDENLNSEDVPMINEAQNPPLPQATNPSSQAAQAPPQIVPSSVVPNRNDIANTLPSTTKTGANPDNQKSSNPNSNNPQSKSKTNQNTNEQGKLNAEFLVELSEETVEYDNSEEQTDENIKKNNSEKPQTPDNNKTSGKFSPVKKENRNDDESYEYESESGSGSYETVGEMDEPVAANAAVATSNK